MKNKNKAIVCSLIIIALALSSALFLVQNDTKVSDGQDIPEKAIAFSDRETRVIGQTLDSADEWLSSVTHKVSFSDDLQDISENAIVIISKNWIDDNMAGGYDLLEKLVAEGSPLIILYDDTSDLNDKNIEIKATGSYHNKIADEQYVYTAETASIEKTIVHAYDWANKVSDAERTTKPNRVNVWSEKEIDKYGWLSVKTTYDEISQGNNYYIVKYAVEAEIRSTNYCVSDLDVKGYIRSGSDSLLLVRSGPGNTIQGEAWARVTLDPAQSYGDLSSWAYPTDGATISDYTSYLNNYTDVRHNYSSNSIFCDRIRAVEPGAMFIADEFTNNRAFEEYTIGFVNLESGNRDTVRISFDIPLDIGYDTAFLSI